MNGGQIIDGLVDLTGGIDESILLSIPSPPPGFKEQIKHLLHQACTRKSMIGCAKNPMEEKDAGILENGLVTGKIVLVLI